MEDSPVALASILLEILGVILLAREVYLGHKVEEIASGLEPTKRLQTLYELGDFRGFYITWRLIQGDKLEDARSWPDTLGPEEVEKAVTAEWAKLAPHFAESLRKWEERTKPSTLLARQYALMIGAGLLVIAAALHFVAT